MPFRGSTSCVVQRVARTPNTTVCDHPTILRRGLSAKLFGKPSSNAAVEGELRTLPGLAVRRAHSPDSASGATLSWSRALSPYHGLPSNDSLKFLWNRELAYQLFNPS